MKLYLLDSFTYLPIKITIQKYKISIQKYLYKITHKKYLNFKAIKISHNHKNHSKFVLQNILIFENVS